MGMYAYPFGIDSPREVEIKLSGFVAEWFKEAAELCREPWIVHGTFLASREVVSHAIATALTRLRNGVKQGNVLNEHQYLLKLSIAARVMAILIEWLQDESRDSLFFG